MIEPLTVTGWPLALFAVLLGLVVGSFVNVLIHRLPRGQSIVFPPSRCPHCGSRIRPLDNIPVLSFLWRGGRCRDCRGRIAWRYPLVEIACGGLFLACMQRFGASAPGFAAAGFCALLLALALIDAEHLILPDGLTFFGMFAGLALAAIGWLPSASFTASLVGLLSGAGALFLLAEAWFAARREEGIGLGDAKMMALLGAFLGWKGAALAFVLGVVLGGIAGTVLLLLRLRGPKSRLPFGVFLAIGGLGALFLGAAPVDRYLDLALGPP
jgi:leader peptidase (prepilin peptidase)/N-methyltransferase